MQKVNDRPADFESFCAFVEQKAVESDSPALISLAQDDLRTVFSYSEVVGKSAAMAGALTARGVGRADVVLTLIGNRPDWIFTMIGCWRIGAVVLPCNEQLRAKDVAMRLKDSAAKVVVTDERNLGELERTGWTGETIVVPDATVYDNAPAALVAVGPGDPALMLYTSGTTGVAKAAVHTQGCIMGQRLQAEHWFDAHPGEIAWCTAASGWSKSSRNVFVTPWLCSATALIQDARFNPQDRLAVIEREQVNVLCMAPTEYRVVARRATITPMPALRRCVSAGEALNPEVVEAWRTGAGLEIYDGYGQTETGAITTMPIGRPVKPGSMGVPLPGVRTQIVDGELCIEPATVPTFFIGYGRPGDLRDPELIDGLWHTGDRVSQDNDGYLWFEARTDDVIISAGYRIGPFEVESALITHPAVAESAVVAAPDADRGSIVRAIVVLREGHSGSDQLAKELQDHVKRETAPYKYPRIVEFADELPKTASGKIQRAVLRGNTTT